MTLIHLQSQLSYFECSLLLRSLIESPAGDVMKDDITNDLETLVIFEGHSGTINGWMDGWMNGFIVCTSNIQYRPIMYEVNDDTVGRLV